MGTAIRTNLEVRHAPVDAAAASRRAVSALRYHAWHHPGRNRAGWGVSIRREPAPGPDFGSADGPIYLRSHGRASLGLPSPRWAPGPGRPIPGEQRRPVVAVADPKSRRDHAPITLARA